MDTNMEQQKAIITLAEYNELLDLKEKLKDWIENNKEKICVHEFYSEGHMFIRILNYEEVDMKNFMEKYELQNRLDNQIKLNSILDQKLKKQKWYKFW